MGMFVDESPTLTRAKREKRTEGHGTQIDSEGGRKGNVLGFRDRGTGHRRSPNDCIQLITFEETIPKIHSHWAIIWPFDWPN